MCQDDSSLLALQVMADQIKGCLTDIWKLEKTVWPKDTYCRISGIQASDYKILYHCPTRFLRLSTLARSPATILAVPCIQCHLFYNDLNSTAYSDFWGFIVSVRSSSVRATGCIVRIGTGRNGPGATENSRTGQWTPLSSWVLSGVDPRLNPSASFAFKLVNVTEWSFGTLWINMPSMKTGRKSRLNLKRSLADFWEGVP